MKISKTLANEIARKMIAHKEDEAKQIEAEFTQLVYDAMYKTIDPKILELQKLYPKYINERTDVCLMGNGFNHEWVSLEKPLPIENDKGRFFCNPTKKEADVMLKKQGLYKDLVKQISALRLDIEATLVSLRTTERARKEWPKCADYLPQDKPQTTAVAINFKALDKRLK